MLNAPKKKKKKNANNTKSQISLFFNTFGRDPNEKDRKDPETGLTLYFQ